METSLKTGFAQIFSRCPKNLSCPKFGGAAAPLAPPARTPMSPDLTFFIRQYEEQERELHDAFYLAPASKNVMNMARHFNHRRTNVNDRLIAAAFISFSLFKVRHLFRSGAYSSGALKLLSLKVRRLIE